MAFIVFVGLIYTIIKSNIDDSLIHAKTQDEFLLNLDTVFSRILKHKIKINTDKVFFGDSHIEFVGHEIPHDGVQFSGTKRKVGHRIFLSHRLKTILKSFLALPITLETTSKIILYWPNRYTICWWDTRGHRAHPLSWTDELSSVFYTLKDS